MAELQLTKKTHHCFGKVLEKVRARPQRLVFIRLLSADVPCAACSGCVSRWALGISSWNCVWYHMVVVHRGLTWGLSSGRKHFTEKTLGFVANTMMFTLLMQLVSLQRNSWGWSY